MSEDIAFGGDWQITDGAFIRATLRAWFEDVGPHRLPRGLRPSLDERSDEERTHIEARATNLQKDRELARRGNAYDLATLVIPLARVTSSGPVRALVWIPTWRDPATAAIDGGRIASRADLWLTAAKSSVRFVDEEQRWQAMRGALTRAVELAATTWALTPYLHDAAPCTDDDADTTETLPTPGSEWGALRALIREAGEELAEAFWLAFASTGHQRGASLRIGAREQAKASVGRCGAGLVELIPARNADWFVTRQTLSCLLEHAEAMTLLAAQDCEKGELIARTGGAWAALSAAAFVVGAMLAAAPAPDGPKDASRARRDAGGAR